MIKKTLYLIAFFFASSSYVHAQELPIEEAEFVNIDPDYTRSLRLEMGFLEPIQNDKFRNFYSGLYHVQAAYLFNIKKNYLLGGYVGNFAIQNTIRDSALFTLTKEQIRNNNYTVGLQTGYEKFTGPKSVLSFMLNTGLVMMNFNRKITASDEIIASYDQNALNVGLTTSYTYFIEEKFTCGLFLSYQWLNAIYEPVKLGYAPERSSAPIQVIRFGLSFNFGAGDSR